jgi:hypothetical protein
MKRFFRIFELTKNERRVVLIVMLVLVAVAFVQYERRVHRLRIEPISTMESQPSPSPAQDDDD